MLTLYSTCVHTCKHVHVHTHSPMTQQAQVAVKESKKRYEKLKFDLGEKIDMVSASRCNLLSRSLPYYQKEVLSFYDSAANEFHKILVDLRSHHHHQYKVRRLAEEIRDLEAEESPFSDEAGLLDPSDLKSLDDDEPLLDVGGPAPPINGAGRTPQEKKDDRPKKLLGSDQFSIEKIQEEAKVKDLALSGIEAELRELQKEVLQPTSGGDPPPPAAQQQTSPKPTQSDQQPEGTTETSESNEFRDLLQLEEDAQDETSKSPLPPQDTQDKLFDDWSSFSAFMPSTLERTKSPTSGWEKELMSTSSEDNSLLGLEQQEGGTLATTQEVPQGSEAGAGRGEVSTATTSQSSQNDLPAVTDDKKESQTGGESEQLNYMATTGATSPPSDLLSEDLKALGISPDSLGTGSTNTSTTTPKPSLGPDMESLDPLYFSQQPPQPLMPSTVGGVPQLPMPSTMLSGQQQPQPPMFRSPLTSSQRPILAPALASNYQMSGPGFMTSPPSGVGGATKMAAASPTAKANGRHVSDEKGKDKASSWMNVFAHLDPLVNEKV